jgi:hypothetical protein
MEAVMQQPRSHEAQVKVLAARLDRWASELNAFLLVFAMGLGVLYGTCLFGMKLGDAILHSGPIGELSATQQISALVR